MQNVVLVGTLHYIQLTVLRYINGKMYAENEFVMPHQSNT